MQITGVPGILHVQNSKLHFVVKLLVKLPTSVLCFPAQLYFVRQRGRKQLFFLSFLHMYRDMKRYFLYHFKSDTFNSDTTWSLTQGGCLETSGALFLIPPPRTEAWRGQQHFTALNFYSILDQLSSRQELIWNKLRALWFVRADLVSTNIEF